MQATDSASEEWGGTPMARATTHREAAVMVWDGWRRLLWRRQRGERQLRVCVGFITSQLNISHPCIDRMARHEIDLDWAECKHHYQAQHGPNQFRVWFLWTFYVSLQITRTFILAALTKKSNNIAKWSKNPKNLYVDILWMYKLAIKFSNHFNKVGLYCSQIHASLT